MISYLSSQTYYLDLFHLIVLNIYFLLVIRRADSGYFIVFINVWQFYFEKLHEREHSTSNILFAV